jgi:predicted nuclease of restriction endonuclease-like (RecB) superfamily
VEYTRLLDGIDLINSTAQATTSKAVNQILTMRNWVIGAYLIEYEQEGSDRALYGEALLRKIADDLYTRGLKGFSMTNLKAFRKFTQTYPALAKSQTLSDLFMPLLRSIAEQKSQTLSDLSSLTLNQPAALEQKNAAQPNFIALFSNSDAAVLHFPSLVSRSAEQQDLPWQNEDYCVKLFRTLSWSHLAEISRIDDPLKRAFYELEAVKSNWSIRELKRQVNSLLYERIGLSKDKDAVLEMATQGKLIDHPSHIFRDPYVLEFLGLKEEVNYSESDLEQALIDHLQQFMHELGRNFCFMERQFRITIANKHHFLDLLFFHRTLRCLVAIDLKLGGFEASHAGQMNLYLNYLKQEVALPDENPPVGILLCSDKDSEEVHYATAGMDSQLFVSRYLVALPSETQLRQWMRQEQERLNWNG